MPLRNETTRGAGASSILLLIAVILAAVGLFYFISPIGISPLGGSKDGVELAKFIPSQAKVFVAADLSGKTWIKIQETLEAVEAQPNEKLQNQLVQIESELGLPLKDYLALLDGRSALGILTDTELPTALMVAGLKDPAAYKAWMIKSYGESTQLVRDVPFWTLSYGAVMGVSEQWVYWVKSGTDEAAALNTADGLIMSSQGSNTLADTIEFKNATGKLKLKGSEIVAYANLDQAGPTLTSMTEAGFDKQTETLLHPLKFALLGVNLTAQSSEGLLGVEGDGGDLFEATTEEGLLKTDILKQYSPEVSMLFGTDLKWLLDLVNGVGSLHPQVRQQVAMMPIALMSVGNPQDIFNQGIWTGNNLFKDLATLAGGGFDFVLSSVKPSAPTFLTLAKVSKNEDAHTFMEKMLSQESTTLKDGEEHHYPSPVPQSEMILKTASHQFQITVGPDAAALQATDKSLANQGLLSEMVEWGKGNLVYLDYTNYADLVKEIEATDVPELAYFKQILAQIPPSLHQGSFAIATSPQGLRYRARGNGGGMTILAGATGAIMVPNFMRARGQGMLRVCKSNLMNIGTALEMYASDHKEIYPSDLSLLTPDYLKSIPQCPTVKQDTYSESYELKKMPPDTGPMVYSIYCAGHHHADQGLAANKPAYNGLEGLSD